MATADPGIAVMTTPDPFIGTMATPDHGIGVMTTPDPGIFTMTTADPVLPRWQLHITGIAKVAAEAATHGKQLASVAELP